MGSNHFTALTPWRLLFHALRAIKQQGLEGKNKILIVRLLFQVGSVSSVRHRLARLISAVRRPSVTTQTSLRQVASASTSTSTVDNDDDRGGGGGGGGGGRASGGGETATVGVGTTSRPFNQTQSSQTVSLSNS
nr:unnamed protein product [Callosobruchus analis]